MCLGLASGYHEPKEEMTPEKALEWVNDFIKDIKEEQAIVNNGDEWHIEALKVFEVIKQLFQDNKRLHLDVKSLENKLIVLKNQNSILSRNADSAFQDGLNEARDLYKAEVQDEIKAEAVKEYKEKLIFEIVNTPTKKQSGGVFYLDGVANRQFEIIDIIKGFEGKEMVGEDK